MARHLFSKCLYLSLYKYMYFIIQCRLYCLFYSDGVGYHSVVAEVAVFNRCRTTTVYSILARKQLDRCLVVYGD